MSLGESTASKWLLLWEDAASNLNNAPQRLIERERETRGPKYFQSPELK